MELERTVSLYSISNNHKYFLFLEKQDSKDLNSNLYKSFKVFELIKHIKPKQENEEYKFSQIISKDFGDAVINIKEMKLSDYQMDMKNEGQVHIIKKDL